MLKKSSTSVPYISGKVEKLNLSGSKSWANNKLVARLFETINTGLSLGYWGKCKGVVQLPPRCHQKKSRKRNNLPCLFELP